ncbi:MAG TPA: PTS sugar transporter subunit IIA [Gemmatimonadales bacterium]|nr:PTS sugar transporter subunit IIA [Gemmatimonadales bacterium]
MTVRDLANYLKLNERTVLKLASQGPMPGVRVGNQWRFRKAIIDAWLDDQLLGISRRYVDVPTAYPRAPLFLELESCFEPKQVVPDLTGTTKIAVIEELAGHAAALGLVRDKHWFIGALIERENIMPTAVGHGIAFPHTRQRHPEQIPRPFLVVGRSREGVDFEAIDGAPTRLFFVLGLRYQELHLPWLTKLAQMMARPEAAADLLAADSAERMFEVLVAAERRLRVTV